MKSGDARAGRQAKGEDLPWEELEPDGISA